MSITPSTTPAEAPITAPVPATEAVPAPNKAPEIRTIQELQANKEEVLKKLKGSDRLSDADKAALEEEYNIAFADLATKSEAEKTKDIGDIQADIDKLNAGLRGEKEDSDEQMDTVADIAAEAEQKLHVENEIRGRLAEFKASIEAKLAAPATPEAVDDGINTPAEAVEAVQGAITSGLETVSEKSQEALKYMEKIGIMPNNFLKTILEFFHNIFWDKRISYDQKTVFRDVVSPYLKLRWFDFNVTTTNNQNQTITNMNKEAPVSIMQKLSSLGVPTEESGKFFGFIMGDITDTSTIPAALVPLFEAGREHFKTLNLDTKTPLASAEAMLNFTPPQTEVADTTTTDTETTEEETVWEGEEEVAEVVIGEEKIVDTAENITAYTELRDAADKILGKKLDEKKIAEKVKETTKPEEKLHTAGVEIFKQLVNTFRNIYGADYAKNLGDDVDTSTVNMLTDCQDGATKIEAKTLATISDMMTKNLEKIFWSGVTKLEKEITDWVAEASVEDENETTRYNYEVAQKLLPSVRGHGSRTGETWEEEIRATVENDGYETLVQQNITQIQNFREIKKTVIDEQTALAYMQATPGLKTEIA
jgi:hypothetical protein